MIATKEQTALTMTYPVVFNRVLHLIRSDGKAPSFRYSVDGRRAIEVFNDLIGDHAKYQDVLGVLRSMRPALAAMLARTMEESNK